MTKNKSKLCDYKVYGLIILYVIIENSWKKNDRYFSYNNNLILIFSWRTITDKSYTHD